MKRGGDLARWLVLLPLLLAGCGAGWVLVSRNLHWLDGPVGVAWAIAVFGGAMSGLAGGIVLAAARANPRWLIASAVSLAIVFLALLSIVARGLARMH